VIQMSMLNGNTSSIHILAKYSRSYPHTSSSDPNVDAEWQHFVNPVIRLLLDIKKSLKGELESVRLRILWSMNSGDESMDIDQRDVGFEDLELLAFSPSPSFKPQREQQSQGLPLKAVYRDTVVGIRYLHPRVVAVGSRPVYRRFQITFMSATAASQFIDAIRNVCPCKANPTSGPARNMTMNPAVTRSQIDTAGIIHSSLTSSRPTTSSSATLSFLPSNETVYPNMGPDIQGPVNFTPRDEVGKANSQTVAIALPESSPPSSSLNNSQGMMLPPPPPPIAAQILQPTATPSVTSLRSSASSEDSFIASLRETPALYHLPRAELEKLVGLVVREDGFAKLLEDLDSMWRVKGFLGR